jgi:hypothetical protein
VRVKQLSAAVNTRAWTASEKDSPKRDLRAILGIAEIIRRFNVIAIQKIKGELRALRDLPRCLGVMFQ